MMTTRVLTPPSMDLNRDMSQSCPDGPPPSVVAIPESGEGLPVGAAEPGALGCPSPASSPNSSGSLFPSSGPTEFILSTKIRSVPRCLFGPPDARTSQFAREKVKEMYEQDKTKYNFDFDSEKPLEGRLKWETVPVAPPNASTGGPYAPKAYALSRFPYLSGSMDRGLVSPPARTTINNNQLPPTRQLYFEPDREPLLIIRGVEEITNTRRSTNTTIPPSTPLKTKEETSTSTTTTQSPYISVYHHRHHNHFHQSPSSSVLDPAVMLIPSPEASSCSSEDSAHVEMELGEDVVVDSSSTEDELKIPSVLSTAPGDPTGVTESATGSSTSSGLSSRISSTSSNCSSSTRRTKSVSSSSSSPSASPSSPTSSQPPITRFLPVRKRPAAISTTKAATESAPGSSPATEKKRAAL